MPSFTFDGFSVGSSVALSALQGAASVSESVTTWGQGPMANVNILKVTAPVVTAPAPVWFEAIELSGFAVPGGPGPGAFYDPSFHEITFVWTIEGAPLAPYAAPQNMVDGWNNANVAYGKRVAFCLTDPGSYTINLWAVDANGVTGTASTVVVVSSPDSVYSSANTILFASDGSFSGAPAGTVQVTTSAALEAQLASRNNPTRLRIKDGDDVASFDVLVDNGRLTHIDTWSGGQATLRGNRANGASMLSWWNDAAETQITIQNIRFVGDWDATEELGRDISPFGWNVMPDNSPTVLVHKCEVRGAYALNPSFGAGKSGNIMIADCVSTNWRGYGIYCQNNAAGRLAVIGTCLAQDPDALNGGRKESDFYNINAGFRDEDCKDIYIACLDVFNITGWSGQLNQNPCLRFGGNGPSNGSVIVDRAVCEGGFNIIRITGESPGVTDHPGNYLLDRVVAIGTARTHGVMIRIHRGGFTARNCYGVVQDVPSHHPENGPRHMFFFDPDNSAAGNANEPVAIYNNTLVSMLSPSNENGPSMELAINSGFANYNEENNVLHVPNGSTPATDFAPIATSTAMLGVTPRYKGVRYNYLLQLGSLSGTITSGNTLQVPYADIGKQDFFNEGPVGATDQAYWQAIQSVDTRHMIKVGPSIYYAEDGQISVTFGASGAIITNTSGAPWPSGANWYLRLDRASLRPTELPLLNQYANLPALPEPRPIGSSSAKNTAVNGLTVYHDFYRVARGSTPSRGAIEP